MHNNYHTIFANGVLETCELMDRVFGYVAAWTETGDY